LRANENDAEKALKVLETFEGILEKLENDENSKNALEDQATEIQKVNDELEEQLKASISKRALAEMFRV